MKRPKKDDMRPEEFDFIRDNCATMTAHELAAKLKRSDSAIYSICKEMGWKYKPSNHYKANRQPGEKISRPWNDNHRMAVEFRRNRSKPTTESASIISPGSHFSKVWCIAMEVVDTKYEKLFDLTRRIRGLQREAKRYRGLVPSGDKDRLRKLEKELDDLIITEIKERQSQQQKIF